MKIGDRVYWHDPDTDPDTNCSGPGQIVDCSDHKPDRDSIWSILKDDGGEVEALGHELEPEDPDDRDEAYELAAARARSNDFEDTDGKDWT